MKFLRDMRTNACTVHIIHSLPYEHEWLCVDCGYKEIKTKKLTYRNTTKENNFRQSIEKC